MPLDSSFDKYPLHFRFDAGTSRGVLKQRDTYFLRLWDSGEPDRVGVGEAAPLKGLSPDFAGIEIQLAKVCQRIRGYHPPQNATNIEAILNDLVPSACPSVRFALETALMDLVNDGIGIINRGPFIEGRLSIPINGLVWMGSFEFMKKQIDTKISEGYSCIKIKIGAIDFEKECDLLEYTRSTYGDLISIRVDANGAFKGKDAFSKLERLSSYRLHSIEQPVKPGQISLMRELCAAKSVPIALDEELIGIPTISSQENLLDSIGPEFIVLKPTLLGGLASSNSWIRLAEQKGIGWWVTSALESNIGLNALAQFTASFNPDLPQGLGTGQLYHNNIPGKLSISKGQLQYSP